MFFCVLEALHFLLRDNHKQSVLPKRIKTSHHTSQHRSHISLFYHEHHQHRRGHTAGTSPDPLSSILEPCSPTPPNHKQSSFRGCFRSDTIDAGPRILRLVASSTTRNPKQKRFLSSRITFLLLFDRSSVLQAETARETEEKLEDYFRISRLSSKSWWTCMGVSRSSFRSRSSRPNINRSNSAVVRIILMHD